MIASSRLAKVVAVFAALGVNASLALMVGGRTPQMGGETGEGGQMAQVEISAQFGDFAGQALTAASPAQPLQAETVQRLTHEPTEFLQPAQPMPAQPVTASEVSTASPSPAPRAVTTDRVSANMLRPAPHSSAVQAAHEERQAARRSAQPVARNAQQNRAASASASNATNRQTASSNAAPQNRSSNSQSQASRAAIQAYPNQVYRCLARAGQVRARGSGTARVRFSISSNGRIGGVALTRSSGNASVDRAVINHIRRAGPCPAPPPGAQRQFSLPVQVN